MNNNFLPYQLKKTNDSNEALASQLAENTSLIRNIFVDVTDKQFGAKGDGNTDDTVAIQSAIDFIQSTGGTVYFPKGNYRTSAPLNIYTNVKLKGDGWTSSYIRPLNNASIPTNQGIIQTKDFLTGRNVWNYYQPYPTGLQMGVALEDICIDGNRANQTTGNGLCLYGGKWSLKRVAVINTAEHGIWTECGANPSSMLGDDLEDYLNMHEATAEQVFISNANKHGWYYKGPNDSYINNVQIKMSGWSGFYTEDTATNMVSGLKVGSLHCYGSNSAANDPTNYMIYINAYATIDKLYIDNPNKSGLYLGDAAHISRLYVYNRNRVYGNYWAVVIGGSGNTILSLKINDDYGNVTAFADGGGVWIKNTASRNIIKGLNMWQQNNTGITGIGLQIDGSYNVVDGSIMNITSGSGLQISGLANRLDLIIRQCNLGFYYKNADTTIAKQNNMKLSLISCTTQLQKDIEYTNDIINIVSSSSSPIQYGGINLNGLNTIGGLQLGTMDFSTGATITLADNKSTYFTVTATQNINFAPPTITANIGRMIVIRLKQDATGSRTVTFDSSVFKTSWPSPDSTPGAAFKRATIAFVWEGNFWMELYRTAWL